MGYEETENRFETEEGLTADEAKVRGMLGGLKRVEAPKDFGFKVQARIARARPETFREKRGLAFLRYAIPLGLVLAVTSAFIINSVYRVNDASVPPVAAITSDAPIALPSGPQSNEVAVMAPGLDPRSSSNTVSGANTLAVNPPRPSSERRIPGSRDTGGGSITSGLESRGPIIRLNPNAGPRPDTNRTGFETRGEISVRAILKIVGINADPSDIGWKVQTVDTNSVAERSGVKGGDLIEAINGLPVTDGTQFSGRFIGKNLRVNRDGKTVAIDLK
jgi:hypothetical protein